MSFLNDQYLSIEICSDNFINLNLTWYSETPRLTRCLQTIGFTSLPAIISILIILIFEPIFIFNSKNSRIKFNKYNFSRQLLCFAIIIANLIMFYFYLSKKSDEKLYTLSDLIAAISRILLFLILSIIYHLHRINGIISSGINFIVTFLMSICFGLILFDSIIYNRSMYTDFEIINNYINFVCTLLLFILSCFADDSIGVKLSGQLDKNNKNLLDNIEINERSDEYEDEKKIKISPTLYSSFLSKITIYWYSEILKINSKGNKTSFTDIPNLEDDMNINLIHKKFDQKFYEEMNKIQEYNEKMNRLKAEEEMAYGRIVSDEKKFKKINFNTLNTLKILWSLFNFDLLIAILSKLSSDLVTYTDPVLLGLLINFMSNQTEPKFHGYLILIGLLIGSQIKVILNNIHLIRISKTTINIEACFMNLLYSKALKLSPKAKRNRTIGELINLCTIDSSKFIQIAPNLCYIFSSPLQIGLAFYLLYVRLGYATYFGLLIIFLMMLLQYKLRKYRNKFYTVEMKYKDSRLKLIYEFLSGIRIIKISGWSSAFESKINTERDKEAACIKKTFLLEISNLFLFSLSPNLVLITVFAIYILFIDSTSFNAESAFVSIRVFNLINNPITVLPTLISNLSDCYVGLKRISSFLAESELEEYVKRDNDNKFALKIQNRCCFAWDNSQNNDYNNSKTENDNTNDSESDTLSNINIEFNCSNNKIGNRKKRNFQLKDIELEIKRGSLTVIIGQVGSGKSSLISAILGEMYLIENDLGKKGQINISKEQNISYVSQIPWIQNTSFKNNILFGKELYKEQYEKVIRSCALELDLKQFKAGDETEIGERGINLSGGQKQRVSLARACYSSLLKNNKDQLIILDDPLSAVDAHVGKHLCENLLNSKTGILKDATRILVTNQLNQLIDLNADTIILLHDGKIELKCTYDELIKMYEDGKLDHFNLKLTQNGKSDDGHDDDEIKSTKSDSDSQKSIKINTEKDTSKLIEDERLEEGKVGFKNYKIYFQYFGYYCAISVLIFLIIENYIKVYSRVYLSNWTDLLENQSFLNNNTIKIININKDHLTIFAILSLSQCFFGLIANFITVFGVISTIRLFHYKLLYSIIHSPMNFFDTIPLGRLINRFSKDMQAIDKILPISGSQFIAYSIGILGSITILLIRQPQLLPFYLIIFIIYYLTVRVYIRSIRILKRLDGLSEAPIYSKLSEMNSSSIRAYNKINDFEEQFKSKINVNGRMCWYIVIGNLWLNQYLILLANSIVLMVVLYVIIEKEFSSASEAGLLVGYTLNIRYSLSLAIRFWTNIETSAISIERIHQYCDDQIEKEDDWIKEDNRAPLNWPSKGEIKFVDYSARYREGTNLVLKDLNFNVHSMEKIGIVGRTGAGKSTITLALFRIIEASEGKILIDNLDISKIGLQDLRSKLSIIPQDPILFTGTIRFNLDPLEQYTDKDIYESLEHAHLKEYINQLEDGIEHKISEGGENLSVGQRQLICLARALLRKSKILVLDEATASVDFTTDELVQKTIRSEFKDCTTITIAHRLNTVLDSSKIMVLDRGELKEYDTPDKLLNNTESLFYKMAQKANAI